jgi:peptide-methionine (R)-S-oxide reductase
LHVDTDGVFTCGGCGQHLFTSAQKFDSGCGWPSFDACEPGTIIERADDSLVRASAPRSSVRSAAVTWVTCSTTDRRPTGLRYCVNSLAVDFNEATD